MKRFLLHAPILLLAAAAFSKTPGAKAESSWPFWNHYAGHFISAEGRVIDPDRNQMTTSEGQSYAMFFALVADDVASFERLTSWTENNLAKGDLANNLPSWSWGKSDDGSWHVLDQNSAADSDLWIAYDLLQAGTLWQKPAYVRTGKSLLANIAREEVAQLPHVGPVLMPGRVDLFAKDNRWILNPSYSPLPLLCAAAHAAPAGPWTQMASALPEWLQRASPAGFAMDWVAYEASSGFSPVGGPGDGAHPARGSYDAIRVYLWAGMTSKTTPTAPRMLDIFSPMARLMRTNPIPPEAISPAGTVLSNAAPPGFSAALVPFLFSSGDNTPAAAQLHLVEADFDHETGLLGLPPRYYDQNLALFALGWQEQRFRFNPDGTLRVRWKN
jgi:endo-1,4-beta-D-glucanase Y